MALLELDGISLSYAGEPTLLDIDLDLAEGEILCLLGPSGSGKTTLLRVVAGLDPADAGTVRFAGQDLAGIAPHHRRFGLMFQEYALFPHLDVFDNVAFGLRQQQAGEKAVRLRVAETLALVGLAGFERRSIDALSGGERQRVALARSLAPQPRLLMLDEPLGALDRGLRDRLAGEIRAILKRVGVSSLMVTHDHEEAFAMADRVAVLDQGRLLQVATPEELYTQPLDLQIAEFLGFRNRVAARLDETGRMHSPLGDWMSPTAKAGGRNTIGTLVIRPDGAVPTTVELCAAERPVVQALLVRRQFQGRFSRLQVEIDGLMLAFDVPNTPLAFREGELIHLALDPGAMLFYPEHPQR